MLVYRIENEYGTGVFDCGAAYDYNSKMHARTKHNAHWPPGAGSEDADTELAKFACDYRKPKENYRFAFQSLNHLKKWFRSSKGRKGVKDQVAVSVYQVPPKNVKQGNWQCVFDKRKAKLQEKLCFETLEPLDTGSVSVTFKPKKRSKCDESVSRP